MGLTTAQFAHICRNLGVQPIAGIQKAAGVPARSKYGAIPTTLDGIRFASKAEARAYQVLKIMESRGSITELRLQPRYELQSKFADALGVKHRAISYIGDFEFLRENVRICVDVKGIEAAGFRVKFKMAIKLYPNIQFEMWK